MAVPGIDQSGAVGFTRTELEAFRDRSVPDLVGPDLRLLFVGINPGLWTAAVQTHFAHPGNRFYPALRRAGILLRDIDRAAGHERRRPRPPPRARRRDHQSGEPGDGEGLGAASRRAPRGADRLVGFVAEHRPAVVAVAGISAYRTAFGLPRAVLGEQPVDLAGARLWVVPNPSGLNAHETVDTLARHYRSAAAAAGIDLGVAPGDDRGGG